MSDIISVRPGRRWLAGGAAAVFVACVLAVLAMASVLRLPGDWVLAVGNTVNVPDPNGGHQPSLVLDGGGNPVVSYRRDAIGSGLAVLHCGNPACTAGNTINTADPAPDVGYHTSLALDTGGNPVVSYLDKTNNSLKLLHCANPNCSVGNTITSIDSNVDVDSPTSLALDTAGNPVISYTDATNVNLKVLFCSNANCSAGNLVATPDTVGDVGYHASLALDAAGNPVVVYLDATNQDLKVLHCADSNCVAGNSITVADPSGGEYTSLTLDTAGNPVVSYYDSANTNLKVLRCGNANCTAGNAIASPDTAGNVGEYTSLALDAAGYPVVSYHTATNSDLKVLHCGNPGCSAGNAIASLDTANSSGWFTSLALDGGGDPIVSYSDPLVGLKVLLCGDANCGAAPAPTRVWGDHNCSGAADPVDSLGDLLNLAQLPPLTHASDCPDVGGTVDVAGFSPHVWGDVDCQGAVNAIDALRILRFVAHLSLTPIAGCPDVGAEVSLS
jgi:hypothetical protein